MAPSVGIKRPAVASKAFKADLVGLRKGRQVISDANSISCHIQAHTHIHLPHVAAHTLQNFKWGQRFLGATLFGGHLENSARKPQSGTAQNWLKSALRVQLRLFPPTPPTTTLLRYLSLLFISDVRIRLN